MPDFLGLTVLEDAVVRATPGIQTFEFRKPNAGIITAFREGTANLISESEVQRLRTSPRRPVKIAVKERLVGGSINNVRELEPDSDRIKSRMVGLTWSTITFSVSVSPGAYRDNYIGMLDALNTAINENLWNALVRNTTHSLEGKLAAFLQANKWATPPASRVRGVSVADGAYVMRSENVPLHMNTIMTKLNIDGPFFDISNTESLAVTDEMRAFGRYNYRNDEQFINRLDIRVSDRLVPKTGAEAIHYIIPKGGVGLVEWMEVDAQRYSTAQNGYFTQYTDSVFGFTWGVRIRNVHSDQSATYGTGHERFEEIAYDFAIDLAPIMQYSTVAGESPIVRVDSMAPAP